MPPRVDFRRYGIGLEEDVTYIDTYTLAATFIAVLIFVYEMTFINLAPSVAFVAIVGAVIFVVGAFLGTFIWLLSPKTFGNVKWNDIFSLKTTSTAALTMVVLFFVSAVFQVMLLSLRPQAGLVGPTDPFAYLLFIQGMAIFETWFFQFALYRFLRGLIGKRFWIFAAIGTSLIFGFGYHYVVYHADLFYESAAFIGSMIYCIALQKVKRLSAPILLHQLQNLRLS